MQQRRHSMTDLVFTLTLFCVFAASALIVVVIGANVYRSTVAGMDENFSTRTAVAYISEKVRENDRFDTQSSVELTTFGSADALALRRTQGEAVYYTYIYYYDGALRELMTSGEYRSDQDLAAGQVIAQLNDVTFEQVEPNLYRFVAVSDTGKEELLFTVHSAA